MIPTWLFLQIILFLTTPSEAVICYWPDGSVDPYNYQQCPDTKVCCAIGETCLSNKLCYSARYNIAYRGACASQSWPVDDCPHICHNEIPSSWSNIFACPNNEFGIFTCGNGTGAKQICGANLSTFVWDAAIISVAQLINSSAKSTPTSNSTALCSSLCECSKGMVRLGAGLGVGLGMPLILALFWLWRLRKRISRDENTRVEARSEHEHEHDDMGTAQQQETEGYHFQRCHELVEVDAINHTLRELE